MSDFKTEKEALLLAMETGGLKHFFKSSGELMDDREVILAALKLAKNDSEIGDIIVSTNLAADPLVLLAAASLSNEPRDIFADSFVSKVDWAKAAEAYSNMEHIFKAREEATTRPTDSKIGAPEYEGALYAGDISKER